MVAVTTQVDAMELVRIFVAIEHPVPLTEKETFPKPEPPIVRRDRRLPGAKLLETELEIRSRTCGVNGRTCGVNGRTCGVNLGRRAVPSTVVDPCS